MTDPFKGDGRVFVHPINPLPGTNPIKVKRAMMRAMTTEGPRGIQHTGISCHSAQGSTLWVILLWCQMNRVAYTLISKPGEAYYVELK